MEKSSKIIPHPKHYWAVYDGKSVAFEGTFKACWDWFVKNYGICKVKDLAAGGIRIARKS